MKEIPLTKGYVALVDDEDYDDLSQYNWHALVSTSGPVYAVRNMRLPNGKRTRILMHRQIMGVSGDVQLDHINRNGCDNRRENLRIASARVNSLNRKQFKNNTTGYRGVYLDRRINKWDARIRVDGVLKFLGIFDTPEDAARAYDREALAANRSHAQLNFPEAVIPVGY